MSTTTYRRETKRERVARFYETLSQMGFTYGESETLRRAQMTLHRWDEQECGDGNDWASWAIERDETTGKPFRCVYPHQGRSTRTPIADREAGALRRVEAVIRARNIRFNNEKPLAWYHQGDCRGCALYILRASDVPAGESMDAYYTRGFACCV